MKKFLILLAIPLLTQCGGGGFGGTSVTKSPTVLNVSGWDPKETQRGGAKYSQYDVSALRSNGGVALIARSAKGPLLDDKFGDFIKSADRQGMMIGAYHFVTMDQDPVLQADNFINRVKSVGAAKGLSGKRLLLVGDFDTKSSPDRLVKFITRVHDRTGVYPVTYLENSDGLRSSLRNATPQQKAIIRHSPYWLALYGPGGTERTMSRQGALTPDGLTELYGVWNTWSMWQYGGVTWGNGRSDSKHYSTSSWRSPRYFGNLAMPMERNVFKGDFKDLAVFWHRHSITL
ncbi:GH25 family lysozyme [Luteolibacter sp. AS25]|uniref:GH25 family lysozyme n=1 Tax=Luteolibacter sp. AS25 TaxID=3135776 RepID=UPI00398B4C11